MMNFFSNSNCSPKIFSNLYLNFLAISILFLFANSSLYSKNEVPNWEFMQGPTGSSVASFAELDNVLFAASSESISGSLYYSSDHGNTWINLDTNLPANLLSVKIHAQNDRLFLTSMNRGLFYSDDLGKTWIESNKGLKNDIGVLLLTQVLSFWGDLNTIVIASNSGLFISENLGISWKQIAKELPLQRFTAMTYFKNKLYVGISTYGIYSSTDFGTTWQESNGNLSAENRYINYLYANNEYIFVGNLRTTERTSDGLDYKTIITGLQDQSGSNVISGIANKLFLSNAYGIYSSTNSGEEWFRANSLENENIVSIYPSKDSTNIYVGLYLKGVYRTNADFFVFENISSGLANTACFAMAIANNTIFASDMENDFGLVWKYDPNTSQPKWELSSDGLTNIGTTSLLAIDEQTLLAGTNGDGIYISTNDGIEWNQIKSMTQVGYIRDFAKVDNVWFAGSEGFGQGVFQSSNKGLNWDTVSSQLPKANTSRMFVDHSNNPQNATLYIAMGASGIWSSKDKGKSFSRVIQFHPNTMPPSTAFYNSVCAKDSLIYAMAIGNVYVSEDMGKTWENRSNGLPTYQYFDIVLVPNGDLYLATTNGIFRSTNKGLNWTEFNNKLSNNKINFLKFDTLTNTLYAGTNGLGLISCKLSATSSIENDDQIGNSSNVSLYPNPTNETLNISLKNDENIQNVQVFDILGNKISIPCNANQVSIDLAKFQLQSGAYLVQIQSNKSKYLHKIQVNSK
jgi:photosystem II stability/assembly factor-like uncharacterized protein